MASWCEGQGATMEVSTATIMVALAHWMQGACAGAGEHYRMRPGRAMSWWTHRETALDMQLSHTWICSYIPTFCIPIFRNLRFRLRWNYNRLASQAISSTEEPSLARISWLVKANVLFYFEFQCKFYSILQTTNRTVLSNCEAGSTRIFITLREAMLGAVVTVQPRNLTNQPLNNVYLGTQLTSMKSVYPLNDLNHENNFKT